VSRRLNAAGSFSKTSSVNPSEQNPLQGVHRLAWATAVATLFLLCVGGMVTSKGVGMSVPDWPNSYGYNMFLLPWNKWREGGVFWEHSHRLKGSLVGLLTLSLAVWLWFSKASPTLKKLGLVAFFGVIIQGVLGGFRVVFDAQIVGNTTLGAIFGVFHAAVAQLFLSLLAALVLMTSRLWRRLSSTSPTDVSALKKARGWVTVGTVLIFCQLLIGATMRHQHAGLAIPDFPLAYGQVWPDTSADAVAGYNRARISAVAFEDITPVQIVLQMVHRILAVGIATWVFACFVLIRRLFPKAHILRMFAGLWFGLILIQVSLGAATIWTGKAADVATAHMAVGALSLVTGALFALVSFQLILSSKSEKLPSSSMVDPALVLKA
jgi:cytochrome c oxidase assembly protein subunit 15